MESKFALKRHAFEFLTRVGTIPEAPDIPRGTFRFAGPKRSTTSKLGWILPHCLRRSKRKVCEGQYQRSHGIHNFSTRTKFVQVPRKSNDFAANSLCENSVTPRLHRNGAARPEEILGKILVCAVRPCKFIHPQWVRSDQQPLFFHQDHARFQPYSLRRIDLIFRAPDAVPVEMHQRVVKAHP